MAEQKLDKISLNQKIHNVMNDVKSIYKGATNLHQNYAYARAEDFISKVRESMLKHGLIIAGSKIEGSEITVKGDKGFITTFHINYTIGDIDSEEEREYTVMGQGYDSTDKGVYKGMTGAFKYFLRTAFMLEMTDDPEKDDNKPEEKPKADTTETLKSRIINGVDALTEKQIIISDELVTKCSQMELMDSKELMSLHASLTKLYKDNK